MSDWARVVPPPPPARRGRAPPPPPPPAKPTAWAAVWADAPNSALHGREAAKVPVQAAGGGAAVGGLPRTVVVSLFEPAYRADTDTLTFNGTLIASHVDPDPGPEGDAAAAAHRVALTERGGRRAGRVAAKSSAGDTVAPPPPPVKREIDLAEYTPDEKAERAAEEANPPTLELVDAALFIDQFAG
jgi:hypothetical protein